jgi:H+/Cl- antiporter ClcA/PII-like signaling protein
MKGMALKLTQHEQIKILPYALMWLGIATVVGILAGSASALFLAALEAVTEWRQAHTLIILGLPLAGLAIGWLYYRHGKSVEGGNNYLIDEIHDPQKIIPLRMAPLILLGTIGTHLFGGSAGREGTAVQMGGALADQITHIFKFNAEDRRILLMAGISAGFASVFGTPFAGAIFGLEVLTIGRLRYDALFPCFIAAVVGHEVTLLWGIHHTSYAVDVIPALSAVNMLYVLLASVSFGIIGMMFANCIHWISDAFKRKVAFPPLRPFIGGILVAAAVFALGTTKYIGLGIPTMVAAFHGQQPPWDFAAKFLFTVVTLGAGFKGGEVTPLFFIGATLGNALSYVLPLPSAFLAGLGFVAVFAGAANTPISCAIMAMELFGADIGIYAAIACVTSYLFSGHSGIYTAQRIGQSKHKINASLEGVTLRDAKHFIHLPPMNVMQDFEDPFFSTAKPKDNIMSHVTILRCYFNLHAKIQHTGFWKNLTAPPLGPYLVNKANEYGIEQAVLHRVTSGFLKGHRPSHDMGETPPPRLPQCLELMDTEEKLHGFVAKYKHAFAGVKIIMLKADAIVEQDAPDIEEAV